MDIRFSRNQPVWHEFLGGSQLVEALYAGAIDIGHASDAVSIFQRLDQRVLHVITLADRNLLALQIARHA